MTTQIMEFSQIESLQNYKEEQVILLSDAFDEAEEVEELIVENNIRRGVGPVWSGRRPVTPKITGSNPVHPANYPSLTQSGLEYHSFKVGVPGSNPGGRTNQKVNNELI